MIIDSPDINEEMQKVCISITELLFSELKADTDKIQLAIESLFVIHTAAYWHEKNPHAGIVKSYLEKIALRTFRDYVLKHNNVN